MLSLGHVLSHVTNRAKHTTAICVRTPARTFNASPKPKAPSVRSNYLRLRTLVWIDLLIRTVGPIDWPLYSPLSHGVRYFAMLSMKSSQTRCSCFRSSVIPLVSRIIFLHPHLLHTFTTLPSTKNG